MKIFSLPADIVEKIPSSEALSPIVEKVKKLEKWWGSKLYSRGLNEASFTDYTCLILMDTHTHTLPHTQQEREKKSVKCLNLQRLSL